MQVVDELFLFGLLRSRTNFRVRIVGDVSIKNKLIESIKKELDFQKREYKFRGVVLFNPTDVVLLYDYCNNCDVFSLQSFDPKFKDSWYDTEVFGELYLFQPCNYYVGI